MKFKRYIGATLVALLTFLTIAITASTSALATIAEDDSVFISEIHYDNAGTDVGEAVEVFGPAGTDLNGWSLVLYNGSNSSTYSTIALSGTIPGTGFGVVTSNSPSNGLQNGSPDGLALIAAGGDVRQFLSYEGVITAANGPALGLTSTDIGVLESSSTDIGASLQIVGQGNCYSSLAWQGPAANTYNNIAPIVPVDGAICDDGVDPEVPLVRFNEIHYDNSGSDVNEAIEIVGPAGTDLSDWSIVLYNGSNGTEYTTVALSGILADQGGGQGVLSTVITGIQNGVPDGMALIDASDQVVELLSYEGTFTAANGPAVTLASVDIGVAESSSATANGSLQRNAAGSWAGPLCASFGELNDPAAPAVCPTPAQEVFVHDIQGSSSIANMIDQRVIIEGVVVADEEGLAPALRGFFVQEEDSDADADPATSEGIFVFNFNNDNVNIGDLVRVEGTVTERFGNTQLTDFVEIEVIGDGTGLATPAVVSFPLASSTDLEAYEGMVVTLSQTLVISEYFNFDRFGDIQLAFPMPGEDRPYNPTAVSPVGPDAQARRDYNILSRITVDDGISFSNPDKPTHPINRLRFSLENSFRGGDQVTGLTGPIFEAFNAHRILPLVDGGYGAYVQTVAPAAPETVAGELTVATLNALNYFLTLDDSCGPAQNIGCRGADNADEFERQRVKLLNALEGLNADVVGLVEVENTTGVKPLADLANGLNDRLGAGTYDYIVAGTDSTVGSDAIKVGIIYKPASVTPLGVPAILDTPDFIDPNDTGSPKNRASVASTFVENASGEVFSVVVNHLKSKGSGCNEAGEGGLAGNCDVTRTLAAERLAAWIGTSPTGIADNDWLIVGDLNSYDQENPIAALKEAGFTDLIHQYQGEFAYSFLFSGELGYLDYVMSSASLTAQVTGATEWHINADEPDVLDYDTSFKSNYQDTLFDETTPFRTSDHDAALVGLSLQGFDLDISATPDLLWPPNYKLRVVDVAGGPGTDVLILGATSSEANSGLGNAEKPNDIQLVDDDTIDLRAERFNKEGRTYTIAAQASQDGQIVFTSVDLVVPHSQGRK
jgi:predicted extracellular nuclease